MSNLSEWQASVKERLEAVKGPFESGEINGEFLPAWAQKARSEMAICNASQTDLSTALKVIDTLRETLEEIKDIQEHLGGDSVLLNDVNAALARANKLVEEK